MAAISLCLSLRHFFISRAYAFRHACYFSPLILLRLAGYATPPAMLLRFRCRHTFLLIFDARFFEAVTPLPTPY